MPNDLQTKTNAEQIEQKKSEVLQPAVKGILWGGGGLLALLLVFTFALPAGRILFFTGSLLSLVTLVIITLQSLIYSGQWKAMGESLAIERAKTDPRLRIAEVTAENFEAGKRPFYIVTIANDGLLAATGVKIHMGIEIGNEKPMDWINDVVVTIPANGREHYFIHSSSWLSREQFEGFDNSNVSLRVVGFFEYSPVGITNFCYKYVPTQGEFRPPKIPQFVPCDFTPRLNTTLQIQTGHFKLTGQAVTMIHGKAEAKPTEGNEDGNNKDEKGNPK
jgi:hypothetical protein